MTNEIDVIFQKTQKLSADETLKLIQKLTADLRRKIQPEDIRNEKSEKRGGIYFGKYADYPGPMPTEEDFKSAEYHFNEDEWK